MLRANAMCLEDISAILINGATQAKWQNSSLLRFCTASRCLDRREVLGRPGADVAATHDDTNIDRKLPISLDITFPHMRCSEALLSI